MDRHPANQSARLIAAVTEAVSDAATAFIGDPASSVAEHHISLSMHVLPENTTVQLNLIPNSAGSISLRVKAPGAGRMIRQWLADNNVDNKGMVSSTDFIVVYMAPSSKDDLDRCAAFAAEQITKPQGGT